MYNTGMTHNNSHLLRTLRQSLTKSAGSALPAAPSVANPSPRPVKTPSYTVRPPAVGKAVADVRPGLSSVVSPRNQSLGTAKSPARRQVSRSPAFMTPSEFRAAAPALPLAKAAQQAQPAVSRRIETAAPAKSVWHDSVRARASALDRQRAETAAAAAPAPKPENPHYEARSGVQKQRLDEMRDASAARYAASHPDRVVQRQSDAAVSAANSGFETEGQWLDRHPVVRGILEAPYDKVKPLLPASWRVPSSQWAHDAANMVGIGVNKFQKGIDWTLSKGMKWVRPSRWGSSLDARLNRLSDDNEWADASRAYGYRHNRRVQDMRTADVTDPAVQRLISAQGALGEFAGSTAALGGVGKGLQGVGKGVSWLGRISGSGAGGALSAGLQRAGLSAGRADAVNRFATGLGTDVGNALSSPLRVGGKLIYGAGKAPAQALGAVRHPAMALRSVGRYARPAYNAVRHPVQAAKTVWDRGLIGKGFGKGLDGMFRAENAYRVGHGVMSGDYGDAAVSAGELGWYDAMRRINPWLGIPLGIGVPVAAHMLSGDDSQ